MTDTVSADLGILGDAPVANYGAGPGDDERFVVVSEFEPAVCTVDFDVSAQCYADCDVNIDIDAIPPRCEGGGVIADCRIIEALSPGPGEDDEAC